jgi:adenine-specific DNA-methyltransferase
MDSLEKSESRLMPRRESSASMNPGNTSDDGEDPRFLTEQLLTYLGNKRALLAPIEHAVERVKRRLKKPSLVILDAFSGSGVVSRLFKRHARTLFSNDLEDYAAVVGRCYLANRSQVPMKSLARFIERMNAVVETEPGSGGIIEQYYSPVDERKITSTDRVFYTRRNARRIDQYRRMIDDAPEDWRTLLLGPLLSEASIHANTAGVFKGFYKDRKTGIGRFGGTNGDALSRITSDITLKLPILSRFECDVRVTQCDANHLVRDLGRLDLAYFDPPYNQHPYGSNYFMLNLIVHNQPPHGVSKVSGIPSNWRRSAYNQRARSLAVFRDLMHSVDASFVLVSFNDEGFIKPEQMIELLNEVGPVTACAIPYHTFRGCRNLRQRKTHVIEHLYLVERR